MLQLEQLNELLALSHQLGMSCLVEVHDENELTTAINSGARIIGINNRNLNTFEVDIAITARLRPLILPDRIVVSESGIKDRNDMNTVRRLGVNAALVGESLMSARNIAARMKEFLA
jgi:indole-3-glycerol phosphate synthase